MYSPTGVPSNTRPRSIWLPWAFFHYRRVCLQSHVAKLHLYLCQWKKFPSGNISRNQGKDLSNLPRSKEVTAGFPSIRPPFPNSSQKNVLFSCPKIIPSASTACSGGAPGWSPGLWCCPQRTSLYSGSRSPSTPSLDGNKEKNKGERTSASCEHCPEGSWEGTALGVLLMRLRSLEPFHPTQHPWGTRVRSF